MSRIERTISFRAEDNGVSQIVERLKRETEEYRDVILQTALDSTKTSREFEQSIDKQIRALERRQSLVSSVNREKINEKYNDSINDVNSEFNRLERRYNKYGTNSGVDIDQARKEQEKNINSLNREKREELQRANDEDKLQVQLLRELIEVVRSSATQEIIEDRANAERQAENSRNGKYDNSDDVELRSRARIQEQILSDPNNSNDPKGGWKDVFKGNFLNTILQGLGTTLNQMASAPNGDFAFNQMFSSIPIVGSGISTALQRNQEQEQARDLALARLRGTAGSGRLYGNQGFGLDTAEGTDLALKIAQSRGFSGGLGINSFMGVSKAFNIDESSLLRTEKRAGYESSGGAMGVLSTLYSYLNSSGALKDGDTTKIVKLLEIQNSLSEEQLKVSETLDTGRVSSVISAFQKLGGRYADPNRAGDAINTLNSSLINPGNEYQQAANYAALQKLNPNASFLDMKMMEEQGVYTKGFLKEILGQLDQQGGGGENSVLSIWNRFKGSGLSAGGAKYLYENMGNFDDSTDLSDMVIRANRSGIMSRGYGNVTSLESKNAQVNDAFAESAISGVTTVMAQVWEKGGKELQSALSSEFFSKSGEVLGNSFLKVIGLEGFTLPDWMEKNTPGLYKFIDGDNSTKK